MTTDTQSKREKLLAKQAQELAKLEREETLKASLPIQPDRIFSYRLYGKEGTISFGSDGYNGKPVSLLDLAKLLKALPPLPMVKVKGAFTQFLGESYYDSGAHKDKRETDTVESIFPVQLKISSVASYSVKAQWLAEVNGEIWEISAIMEKPYDLARVHAKCVNFMGGHRYEPARLEVNSKLNPTDGYWNSVRWSMGSTEWPNDFTAYHGQYDENPVAWATKAFSPMRETQFDPALQG